MVTVVCQRQRDEYEQRRHWHVFIYKKMHRLGRNKCKTRKTRRHFETAMLLSKQTGRGARSDGHFSQFVFVYGDVGYRLVSWRLDRGCADVEEVVLRAIV